MARAICPIITALAVCALVGVLPHAIAAGVNIDDSTKQTAYAADRDRLVNSDCEASYGYVQYGDYTEDEKTLHNIIMNLKFEAQKEIHPETSMKDFHEHVANSKLFHIIEAMPKFGLLRAHIGSLLDPKDLMDIAEEFFSELFICCHTDGTHPVKFSFKKETGRCHESDEHSWLKMETVKNNIWNEGAGAADWDKYKQTLIDKLSISNASNGYEEFKDHSAAWDRFNKQYVWSNILKYEGVWEKVLEKIIDAAVKQNIQYLEIHATLSNVLGKDQNNLTIKAAYDSLMNKVAESKKKHSDKFVGAKVIYAPFKKDVTSIAPLEEINDFAGELAGIDLVGHDEKYPVSQYTGFVVEAQFKQNLAAYLQAGETEWRTYTDEGLFDAVLLDAKRIGHALTLVKHVILMERVKLRKIAIEVCPLSNKMLKLVHGEHPAKEFRRKNIPLIISSDNPAFWSAKLLAHDFYLALLTIALDTDGLDILKEWVLNSIEYSSLSEDEKFAAKKQWLKLWEEFVKTTANDDRYKDYKDMKPASSFDVEITQQ